MAVTIHLRDRGNELAEAWRQHFENAASVHPASGDVFGVKVDAVVSPANCFGFMDGGIDAVYLKRFGSQLQSRVQEEIARDFDGELPIGLAVIVETGAKDFRYLIAAPTMRAPVKITGTLNAYLAFRAALRAVKRFNEKNPGSIASFTCPGLGTGTGELPAEVCARQMRAAWDEVEGGKPFHPKGVNDVLLQHHRLLRDQ